MMIEENVVSHFGDFGELKMQIPLGPIDLGINYQSYWSLSYAFYLNLMKLDGMIVYLTYPHHVLNT
jgi:hypothetical protein